MIVPSHPTNTVHPWGNSDTPFEEIGGDQAVRDLSEAFYDVIETEAPTLRAMLPSNTKNTRVKFYMYLSGWLGGPPLYEQKWGHPQLRRRHMPFPIDMAAVSEWMGCMERALDRVDTPEPLRTFLVDRFGPLAEHMRNQPD